MNLGVHSLLNLVNVDTEAFEIILDKAQKIHYFLQGLRKIAEEGKKANTPMLLSSADAAMILGKTPNFLNVLRHRGDGPPFYRIGGSIYYDLNDLLSYIESCRQHVPQRTIHCIPLNKQGANDAG